MHDIWLGSSRFWASLVLQNSHLCLDVVHLSEASAFNKDTKGSINSIIAFTWSAAGAAITLLSIFLGFLGISCDAYKVLSLGIGWESIKAHAGVRE